MASSVSIRASLNGDSEELLAKLNNLNEFDKNGILNAIGEGLRTSTIERFQSQTSPDGSRWSPSIRASSEGGKTLIKTSVLRGSINVETDENGVVVGTNDIRAATLQFGDERTIRAKKSEYLTFKYNGRWVSVKSAHINIPARPFIGLSEEDEQEIKEILEDAFNDS